MKTTITTPDAARARTMRAVKATDTGPEMRVRRLVHQLGYRYRLHRNDLLGKPDLVFPGRRKIVFVHGCWWHGHHCARGNRVPVRNREYWQQKVERNRQRDARVRSGLEADGWTIGVIWECELKNEEALRERLVSFLG